MTRNLLLKQGLACIFLLFCLITQGQSGTQPKFSVIPVQRAPAQLPANAIATAQYAISNNTNIPRTLTMVAIAGISQDLGGVNSCSHPFVLPPGGFCLLNLVINAAALGPLGVHQGPKICKTKGPYDPSPDPFLCSQADYPDNLNISIVPAVPVSVSPNPLSFTAGGTGTLTIQNISAVPVSNFNATVAAGSAIGIYTSNCPATLLSGASCTVTLGSAIPASTRVSIRTGSNIILTTASVIATPASMSISPSPLSFTAGGTGTLTVQNTSVAPVNNLTATVPPGSVITVSSSTCSASLAPGNSCTITFSAATAGSATLIVRGSNTSTVAVPVTAAFAPISVSPSPLSFTAGGTGTLTVQNTSAVAVNNLTAVPTGSVITVAGSTCGASLAPGSSCTFTLSAATAGSATLTVRGSNTAAVAVPVTAISATISVSPSPLSFIAGGTGTLTVQNTSAVVVYNLTATVPTDSVITVSSSTCSASLAPGNSCTITLSTAIESSTTLTVQGSNTSAVAIPVTAALASISVSPPVLLFAVNDTSDEVTVTNESTVAVNNLAAVIQGSTLTYTSDCPPILPVGGFCHLSFTAPTAQLRFIAVKGSNTVSAFLMVNVQRVPIAIVNPAPPAALALAENGSGTITIKNTALFNLTAKNIEPKIPASSALSVTNNNCFAGLAPGATCTMQLNAQGEENTRVPIWGSNTTGVTLNVTVTEAVLDVSPSSLTLSADGVDSQSVTVTNNSAVAVTNVAAAVPEGSSISAVSTCPANLLPSESCTISFSATQAEAQTAVTIQGNNTSPASVSITVLAEPVLSVSSNNLVIPVNGAPVNLTVTNNAASTQAASNIQAVIPSSLPGVEAYPEPGCSNLAAGDFCIISFSSNQPHAALSGIEVKGDNTVNNPSVALAFTQGGGYVFDVSSAVLVADMADQSNFYTYPDAVQICTFSASGGYTDWVLPNISQLLEMYEVLYQLGFGNFMQDTTVNTSLYWSSTESSSPPLVSAQALPFETGGAVPLATPKTFPLWVRCMRNAS